MTSTDRPPAISWQGSHVAARLGGRALLAAQRLGQDARRAGLADAARAREQERVVHPVLRDGVRQRPRDVLLADQLREALRPVLARQDQIRHPRRIYFEPQRWPTPFCAPRRCARPRPRRATCRAVRRCLASHCGSHATRQAHHQGPGGAAGGARAGRQPRPPGADARARAAALLDQEDGIAGADPAQARRRPGRSCASRWPRRWTRSRRCSGAAADIYVGRRLKDLLEEATRQSKEFKDEYVSTEHLLLALVRQGLRRRQPGAQGRRRAQGRPAQGAGRGARQRSASPTPSPRASTRRSTSTRAT